MRSPELPIDEATFVGLWLETFLYGVSAVLVCSTLAVLRKSRPSAPINKPILSATLLMFAITTAHIGLNFTRTFHALFSFQDVPGGSNIYIEQNDALYVAANILIGIQVVLGDATNLYRLWMVWNRLWRPMVVPGVLFLASATSDCLSVILLFKTNDVIGSNQGSLRTPVLVFEIISIVQPMVTSALIVLRLWKLEKNVSSYRIDTPSSTSPILRMIIESAAFYAVAMLVVVILGFFNVPGFLIAIQMIAPIVSIVSTSMTVAQSRVDILVDFLWADDSRWGSFLPSPARRCTRSKSTAARRRSAASSETAGGD